jgi:hypothetical protein
MLKVRIKIALAFVAFSLFPVLNSNAGEVADCDTVDACLSQISQIEARIRVLPAGVTLTETSYVFTQDRSKPKLGAAWRDPYGTIWSEAASKNAAGYPFYSQYKAIQHCTSLGAELPDQQDFLSLQRFMGRGNEFKPQVFLSGNYAWTSTVVSTPPYQEPGNPNFSHLDVLVFEVETGRLHERHWVAHHWKYRGWGPAVYCVVRR